MKFFYHILLRHIVPAFLALILLIVVFYERVGIIEGTLYPVVSNTELVNARRIPEGMSAELRFYIKRDCQPLELTWYKDERIVPVFHSAGLDPKIHDLSVGWRISGPWTFIGIESLKDVSASIKHRCHPLWITTSQFY